MVFFRPYTHGTSSFVEKIVISNSPILKGFSYFYILCAIVSFLFSWSDMSAAFFRGSWNDVIGDAYSAETIEFYHSPIERFCKNICGYTESLALILSFFYLTDNNYKPKLSITLILSIIASMMTTTVIVASRGAFAGMFIKLLAGYILFKDQIDSKTTKRIQTGGIVVLTMFLLYTLSVTFSRFADVTYNAEFDDPISSLVFYFGHSMLTFDDGIADSIQRFMWGDYLLGNRAPYPNGVDAVLGTHFGSSFFTFVGALYLDFGPVITLIIALVSSNFLLSVYNKQIIRISHVYIYYYFLCFFINGVFVVGRGYYIGILMAFVLYWLLKRID